MADLVVELGAVVVVVAAVVGVDALADGELPDEVLDEVPDSDADDVVELTEVSAEAVVPGISLDTTRPSTAVAPAARMATAVDVRRTLVWARSRRCDPMLGEVLTTGMSPCQPRITRTVG